MPDSLFRDQVRAQYAYEEVGKVEEADREKYKIAVDDLGINILRGGLCAAIAAVQRSGVSKLLLGHLAGAGVPGLPRPKNGNHEDGSTLANAVRELSAEKYMIATREMLKVAAWLKRAVQATFPR